MKNETISGAALLYYVENVEGEPLTKEVPLACFHAGAQFVIDAQTKRNNCNIPEGITYNARKRKTKRIMDNMLEKISENIGKMIKVTGFYITAPGDESVGIPSTSWELKNNFHFDNQDELDNFKTELKGTFEWYCGEVTSVLTFEEHNAILEAEIIAEYKLHPVRFLIRYDKDSDLYMKQGGVGMYSGDVGECIQFELPHYMSEENELVIPSTSDEYWEIIKVALHNKQRSADVDGQHYRGAKNSVQLLLKELNYGS